MLPSRSDIIGNEILYQTIFKRKSVRKISPGPLDETTLSNIREFISNIRPMVPGIRTEIRLISSSEVKGMLRNDGPHSIVLFSEPKDGYLFNAGFMLQQLDLHL
ncbi:MAG TPA: nitroreductase family protein, partial [Methanomassiliicoccales archaeon]|nr:nitroreductase family protein [Methanomassiliicoccales archaeon]